MSERCERNHFLGLLTQIYLRGIINARNEFVSLLENDHIGAGWCLFVHDSLPSGRDFKLTPARFIPPKSTEDIEELRFVWGFTHATDDATLGAPRGMSASVNFATVAIPEPSAALLGGLGLLALLRRRR